MAIHAHGTPACIATGCQHPLCILVRETTPHPRQRTNSVPSGRSRDRLDALIESGWSMKRLAAHIGYPESTLRSIRAGKWQFVSTDTAEDILSVPLKETAA